MPLRQSSSIPLKLPGSSGTAAPASNMYCLIQAIDPIKNVAHVRDQLGGIRQISLNHQIGKGYGPPQEGETWMLTSLFGDWMFAVQVDPAFPDLVYADINGGTMTTAFTCSPNSSYKLNAAASLGNLVITLPTAPPDLTEVAFYREDSNFSTTSWVVTTGGVDAIDGSGSTMLIGGQYSHLRLRYIAEKSEWFTVNIGMRGLGGLNNATASNTAAPSLMIRDSAGRSKVSDPSAAQDISSKAYVDASTAKNTVTLNSTGTATANALHLMTVSADTTVTLPAAPGAGTVCQFVRLDSTAFTTTIQPGGTDTMVGTSPHLLKSLNSLRLTYNGTSWTKVAQTLTGLSGIASATSASTASTVMTRDSAGRSQIVDPSAQADIATKAYVDKDGGYYRVVSFSYALVSGVANGPNAFTTVVDGGTSLIFSDYGTCTSAASGTASFVAPVDGVYSFHVVCDNLLTNTANARLAITRNGNTVARNIYTSGGGGVNAYSCSAPNIWLAASDLVTFSAITAGPNVTVTGTFWMKKEASIGL